MMEYFRTALNHIQCGAEIFPKSASCVLWKFLIAHDSFSFAENIAAIRLGRRRRRRRRRQKLLKELRNDAPLYGRRGKEEEVDGEEEEEEE